VRSAGSIGSALKSVRNVPESFDCINLTQNGASAKTNRFSQYIELLIYVVFQHYTAETIRDFQRLFSGISVLSGRPPDRRKCLLA
jgi:hypothetical protein